MIQQTTYKFFIKVSIYHTQIVRFPASSPLPSHLSITEFYEITSTDTSIPVIDNSPSIKPTPSSLTNLAILIKNSDCLFLIQCIPKDNIKSR